MSFQTTRDSILSILELLKNDRVYTPNLKRVYEFPPQTIQDQPCAILYGGSGEISHAYGGLVTVGDRGTERVRLLVQQEGRSFGVEKLLNLHYNFLSVMENKGGLTSTSLAVVSRIVWEAPAAYVYGGPVDYAGMDYTIEFVLRD